MTPPLPDHVRESLRLKSKTLRVEAAALCCKHLPGWGGLDPFKEVAVSELAGGITNILLKLAPRMNGLEPVALRVFGENTEVVIDRAQELRVIGQLNGASFGASIILTFENGRIESFIYGRTLMPEEFSDPDTSKGIAERLADFHSVHVSGVPEGAQCFPVIRRWITMAAELDFSHDPKKQEAHRAVDFNGLRAELAAAESLCGRLASPVVWCHNDLLSGNVMILKKPLPSGSRVQFIDFEYGAYNPRGFDLGNHFNEWAGFDCDYSLYPNPEQQKDFAVAYLTKATGQTPSDSDVSYLIAEANAYSLVSHMYWGTWAFLQARYSPIDFDYMGYSGLRWGECRRRWNEVEEMVEKAVKTTAAER